MIGLSQPERGSIPRASAPEADLYGGHQTQYGPSRLKVLASQESMSGAWHVFCPLLSVETCVEHVRYREAVAPWPRHAWPVGMPQGSHSNSMRSNPMATEVRETAGLIGSDSAAITIRSPGPPAAMTPAWVGTAPPSLSSSSKVHRHPGAQPNSRNMRRAVTAPAVPVPTPHNRYTPCRHR
jgi:hypothetical protein